MDAENRTEITGAASVTVRRLLFLDPGLGDLTGHWVTLASRLAGELKQRGIAVELYGRATANASVLEGLQVRPTFRHLPWATLSGSPASNADALAREYLKDLSVLKKANLAESDLLVFPSLLPGMFDAVIRFCESLDRARAPRVACVFQFSEGSDILVGRGPNVALYRRAFSSTVGDRAPPNLRFFSSSSLLAQRFSVILGQRVQWLPMPLLEERTHQTVADRSALKIGYFGHASLEKGTQFLDRIVRHVAEVSARTRFTLHLNPNPDTREIIEKLRRAAYSNVTYLADHLPEHELRKQMEDVDIVLLPYDRGKYEALPSLVFCEAAALEKVLVIPKNTWMASEAAKIGLGIAQFDHFRADAICEALVLAIHTYDELSELAHGSGPAWRARHSVARLVDALLARANWAEKGPDAELGWGVLAPARMLIRKPSA
jgi:hypothetical protein